MLPPAASEAAADFIRSLGLSPDRPLLGVTVRGWFHRRGGFVPRNLRARLGMQSEHGSIERERLSENLATELRRLARRLDAAVLLMPSYRLAHEGDLQACQALAARLDGVPAATALIDDPALYKAVAGRLALMISARMHPLIFAASMGVPVVGLAYNDKFEGVFQLLGLENQLLQLQGLAVQAQEGWLEIPVRAALANSGDMRQRCTVLAERVRDHTASLLQQ
jgi:polysaccharide pyruvyl transferase WcaK-like protein